MTSSLSSEAASTPFSREALHHRSVQLTGYRRSDGLWDIEATLIDTRTYGSIGLEKGHIPAGAPVHHMWLCVTLDDKLVVQSITAHMLSTPYSICKSVQHTVDRMAGAQIGPGWRRLIDQHLGNAQGCTHLREMLLHVATTAYQTIPVWHGQSQGDVIQVTDGKPPNHLGKCAAWAFDGPVVQQHYPQFFRWKNQNNSGGEAG